MATKKGFDISDAARKFFLAGVGAVSVTAEKSKDVVDDLVKRGEISVKQGRELNKELTKKATEAVHETTQKAIKAHLQSLTPEERKEFVANINNAAKEIDGTKKGGEKKVTAKKTTAKKSTAKKTTTKKK